MSYSNKYVDDNNLRYVAIYSKSGIHNFVGSLLSAGIRTEEDILPIRSRIVLLEVEVECSTSEKANKGFLKKQYHTGEEGIHDKRHKLFSVFEGRYHQQRFYRIITL